ncbi:MAG: U32 family peptidase [Lachnospiraceae bacterium]|nr:U32 family peptidase [Lachnospiraceae bacterium]
MNKIEILAPAGSMDALKASINAGCDAVYIGGSMFGARAAANNLDEEAMLKAIDYAHVRGKQLYMTVNTLLKNEELEEHLYRYIKPFYEHGLDAVIVQDVGVMNYIHKHFKDLPIHASTQMTLTMAEGAKIFEDMGVTRMVTSRELGLDEIARIRKNTKLEIESFVHGALCYSFSGQCLMSSMIGGRSGNRGRCAQPCRMEYSCKEGGKTVSKKEDSYILSPKDMCTLDMVAECIEAGIDSFKIEGRMKRYEYAAGVVAAYRKQIDQYLELGPVKYREFHKKHPEVLQEEVRILQDLYNRGGFSTGYYKDHNGKKMMSMHRPNHSGVYVGKVVSVKGISATIALEEDVNAQDVLEIRMGNDVYSVKRGADGRIDKNTTKKNAYEFTVKCGEEKGKMLKTNFMPGSNVKPGDEVYRTKNNELLTEISEDYYEHDAKVKMSGMCVATPGEPLLLTLTSHVYPEYNEKEITITVTGDVVDAAMKQPMTEEKIKAQLMKTNDTPFVFTDLEVYLGGDVFLPVSKLNEIRRMAIAKLEEEMAASFRRELVPYEGQKADTCEKKEKQLAITAYIKSEAQLQKVLEKEEVGTVYLDMVTFSFEQLIPLAKRVKKAGKKVFLVTPHIFRSETYDLFNQKKEMFMADEIDGFVIKNFESLYFFTKENAASFAGKEMRLDYNMYVMNKEAKEFYKNRGISHTTASVELNASELRDLGIEDMDIVAYGRLPVMVSAQCVKKNTSICRLAEKGKAKNPDEELILTDRMGKNLDVITNCRFCYNVILSPDCISLASVSEDVLSLDPSGIRLDFTLESGEETEAVLDEFVDVFCYGKASKMDESSYTKGHFRRGIM